MSEHVEQPVVAASFVRYRMIPEYPAYRVGDDGSVWSRYVKGGKGRLTASWRKLVPVVGSNLHLCVTLCNHNGKRKKKWLHRLVLEVFVGPRPNGFDGCHYPDKNPANNSLWNLRWDTRKANVHDSFLHGTAPRGERHGISKLTEEQVLAIRDKHASGTTYATLGTIYGICISNVHKIVHRKTWVLVPCRDTIEKLDAVLKGYV